MPEEVKSCLARAADADPQLLPPRPKPLALAPRRCGGGPGRAGRGVARPGGGRASAGARARSPCAGQSLARRGGARARQGHRRGRRRPLAVADARRPRRHDGPRARRVAAPLRQPPRRGAALHRSGRWRGRRRHAPVLGAGQRPRRRSPGPARGRGDGHGWGRPRHPGVRRPAWLPRAPPCARHRTTERARPPDQASGSAALRHRRQGPDHPGAGDGAGRNRLGARHGAPRRPDDPQPARHDRSAVLRSRSASSMAARTWSRSKPRRCRTS